MFEDLSLPYPRIPNYHYVGFNLLEGTQYYLLIGIELVHSLYASVLYTELFKIILYTVLVVLSNLISYQSKIFPMENAN